MLKYNFKKWNTLLGWFAFIVAITTYLLTIEPTLSFWDAGEYISTSTKLEVGHPPGAPLFQMLGALFSIFAFSKQNIALMVNMVSAFSSAFTILFMFWSSTNMLYKIVALKHSKVSPLLEKAILGSSLIGALTFTFSDTFWFSAVETEVYATAMFLISLLLWLGLRWVDEVTTPRGYKWILLISLVLGMSFGVHFMALLTIPSIGYLYYFKKYPKVTIVNFLVANILIVSVLLVTFLFVMPLTMAFFGKAEIFAVNSLGLPFNSGTILAFLILTAVFVFALKYTQKNQMFKANTLVLCFLFLFIGFSCWLMLPIRANTQIPINENKPSDATELLAYYNREQYGSRSLFYDTYFTTKYRRELDAQTPYVDGKPNYERDEKSGKYVIVNNYKNTEENISRDLKGFLPRMHRTDGNYPVNYMRYTKALEFTVRPEHAANQEVQQLAAEFRSRLQRNEISLEEYDKYLSSAEFSEYFQIENPSFVDNMKFMFDYQFGYMFWRYLMWNFSGRQNDIQGMNDRTNGNWVTGIDFIDEIRLGSQKNLPSDTLNNKGRNHYYMLPFLLGLLGFIWHFRRDAKSFYVLLALFLFTGIALKIFVNESPFEPRERDYSVVPAFMVFALWVGFGAYALYEKIQTYTSTRFTLPVVLSVCFLASPFLLAKENWNDHDRSDKYTALEIAKAYLDSVEPNGIIFTIADNDTFPLWYLQEVEEYRTDVRVVCTSLLQTDWYIDQMKVKAYNSEPLKIRFNHNQYKGDKMNFTLVAPTIKDTIDVNSVMDYIASDDPRTKHELTNGEQITKVPTDRIRIPVDKQVVLKNKIVPEEKADEILPYLDVHLNTNVLYRSRVIMFDIIANNNWERPVYFSGGSFSDEDFLWMKDYLQLDGFGYKLVPIKAFKSKNPHPLYIGNVATSSMYNKVMQKWELNSFGSTSIYHDPETRRNSLFFRTYMARLAEQLLAENQLDKASKVIEKTLKSFPIDYYGNYATLEPLAEMQYMLKQTAKADALVSKLAEKYKEQLVYYQSMPAMDQREYFYEIIDNIQSLERLKNLVESNKSGFTQELTTTLNQFKKVFHPYLQAAGLDDASVKAREQKQLEKQLQPKDSLKEK